ncbi:MAG: S16 family serine protease [Candidatus Bilamarchaeaceae archaeon]
MGNVPAFLAVLLAISLAQAGQYACAGNATMPASAVAGSSSQLIGMTLSLMEGSGRVFISTDPPVGIDTQRSLSSAREAVFSMLDIPQDGCDVFLVVKSDAPSLEGPSGGVVFSLLLYSAATGKQIRNDTLATGAIGPDGGITQVGGLFEKSLGAARGGMAYFVMPVSDPSQDALLIPIKERYGLKYVEVSDLGELVGFFFNGTIPEQKDMLEPRPMPNLTLIQNPAREFNPIVDKMMVLERSAAQSLPEGSDIRGFYENEMLIQESKLANGYVFTAANDAFLTYIDAKTFSVYGNSGIEAERDRIWSCIGSIPSVNKTSSNYGWAIGSDLRRFWAEEQMEGYPAIPPELEEERFAALHQMMYADAWCQVASALAYEAQGSPATRPMDEYSWEPTASEFLKLLGELQGKGSDVQEKEGNAKALYMQGLYGASIYESVFALGNYESDLETSNLTDDGLRSRTLMLLAERPSSLWGRVYWSQAKYLYNLGDMDSVASAHRLAVISKMLDEADGEMASFASGRDAAPEIITGGNGGRDGQEGGYPPCWLPIGLALIACASVASAIHLKD